MKKAVNPAPAGGLREGRVGRYAKVDLSGISVRKAVTDDDFVLVGRLREAGFSRVVDHGDVEWVDDFDRSPGVFSLIAYNSLNDPVATMRVQDGRIADLELSHFVPLDDLLKSGHKPAAQFARLSVIKTHQSTDAMFGLFKAAWRWCLGEGLQSIVIATPPWSRPIYDSMFFYDLGVHGHFAHRFAGGALHVTMSLSVEGAEAIWRGKRSPLCEQIFDIVHPSLAFD